VNLLNLSLSLTLTLLWLSLANQIVEKVKHGFPIVTHSRFSLFGWNHKRVDYEQLELVLSELMDLQKLV
jgi:hypothetical protein